MGDRVKLVGIFLVAGIFLNGCSGGIHTSSWKAKGVDFRKYKSYAWLAPGDSALNTRRDDKLFAGTIEYHANAELKKRGLSLDTREPDAVFMFDTHVEDRITYSQSPTLSLGVAYGGPGYYVGGSAPVAGGQITANEFKEGMLVIEMFDMTSKQRVWRGVADSKLDNSTDIQAVIQNAIKTMFTTLPVKKM